MSLFCLGAGRELWRNALVFMPVPAMAFVLSSPRLPVVSSTAAAASASSRASGSQCSGLSSRQPIWSTFGLERTLLLGSVPDGSASRNVGLETQIGGAWSSVRCSLSEEQGTCTTSCSGRNEIQDEASPGRRKVLNSILGVLAMSMLGNGGEALARDRRNKKTIAETDYLTSDTGIKYFDIEEGKGAVATKGESVMVHFDCVYKTITAVSSRESKLLAGNRTIAEPYELTVGAEPGRERKRDFVDNANGLFSAQAAPKPPPVLYSIVEGMRVGGKRTVIVTPELGYGKKGQNEIPPGATFELNIELLEVKKPQT
uniref:peptidylprolyl isomerase n=2 Tax=Physcomitrium patens TaxID=3218 RepID=A0A2K1IDE4_PHYPA|nr:hypothetical protein PHYPA_029450 [Physcomitrium patens]